MSQGKEQTVLGESALSRYSDLSLKAYSQSVSHHNNNSTLPTKLHELSSGDFLQRLLVFSTTCAGFASSDVDCSLAWWPVSDIIGFADSGAASRPANVFA